MLVLILLAFFGLGVIDLAWYFAATMIAVSIHRERSVHVIALSGIALTVLGFLLGA